MHEAKKGFRRLKAFRQLPALRAALAAHYEKETNATLLLKTRRPLNVIHSSARFPKFNRARGNSHGTRQTGRSTVRSGSINTTLSSELWTSI
jgi:hypothetical protein